MLARMIFLMVLVVTTMGIGIAGPQVEVFTLPAGSDQAQAILKQLSVAQAEMAGVGAWSDLFLLMAESAVVVQDESGRVLESKKFLGKNFCILWMNADEMRPYRFWINSEMITVIFLSPVQNLRLENRSFSWDPIAIGSGSGFVTYNLSCINKETGEGLGYRGSLNRVSIGDFNLLDSEWALGVYTAKVYAWFEGEQNGIKVKFGSRFSNEVSFVYPLGLYKTKPDFRLKNYPNPFNPVTEIRFEIFETAFVDIAIFNILGERIVTLANGEFVAGEYRKVWDASIQPTGIYLCRLGVGDHIQTIKMVLSR